MIVDGRLLADTIYGRVRERIAAMEKAPVLGIFTCAPNFETRRYLALKASKAALVGLHIKQYDIPETATTEEVILQIREALPHIDGAILQLPFPVHMDHDALLRAVPADYDVDALNPENQFVLSPVVAACKEILGVHGVSPYNQQVTILGSGRLVGIPASKWFMEQGSHVSVVTRDTLDISYYTKHADIIVCGAGDPGFLTPDMIKEGSVILDAGTSEDGGVLRGDADEACGEKAAFFTPVPGGIGPMTIAMLFENLCTLIEIRGKRAASGVQPSI